MHYQCLVFFYLRTLSVVSSEIMAECVLVKLLKCNHQSIVSALVQIGSWSSEGSRELENTIYYFDELVL